MKIKEFFGKGRTVFSFEVFPPKQTSPVETVLKTLEKIRTIETLKPDYISVTYGAGGNAADIQTRSIVSMIKNEYKRESMMHLTCVNSTKEDVVGIIEDLKAYNIENILALRGDINPNVPPKSDFKYACQLIEFIKARGDFGISAACYPEGHCEAESPEADIRNLKYKVDMGVDTLVTQLFFDNTYFYDFMDKARSIGINVPVSAGIMPVTSKKQIERMVATCGASIPQKLAKIINKYGESEAMADAGIAYAVDQIVDLIANDVEGIHLYTMNNPYVAKKIYESVINLL